MESARRASTVHEKRTGRALRVTEADVINEEMYEEINDLPSEYHRLNAHLRTQSVDFDRRLLAYLSCQIATRDAVSNCWQNDRSQFDNYGASPGTLQGPSSHAALNHPAAGRAINYKSVPRPSLIQTAPRMQHGPSTPTATPGFPGYSQQYLQSPFDSPPIDGRHISLPSYPTPHPSWPSSNFSVDPLTSDDMSRVDSAVDMASNSQYLQHPTLHGTNDPRSSPRSWQSQGGRFLEPLSTSLPLNGQQLHISSPQAFGFHVGHKISNSPSHDFPNRRYSYNPNGNRRPASNSLSHPYSNHFQAPTSSGQNSPSQSPIRSDKSHESRPNTSCGSGLSQVYHDADGVGHSGNFTGDVLKETDNAVSPGTT